MDSMGIIGYTVTEVQIIGDRLDSGYDIKSFEFADEDDAISFAERRYEATKESLRLLKTEFQEYKRGAVDYRLRWLDDHSRVWDCITKIIFVRPRYAQ